MQNYKRYLLILTIATSIISCFNKNKKDESNSDDILDFSDSKSIEFNRVIDRPRSATLRFNTKIPLFCKLSIFSTNIDNPEIQDCSNYNTKEQIFSETINDLKVDHIYSVEVFFYADQSKTDLIGRKLIKEPYQIGNNVNTNGINDLIIVRMNKPLQTANIYRHSLGKIQTALDIRNKLTNNLGCETNTKQSGFPFSRKEANLNISDIISTDFALGNFVSESNRKDTKTVNYQHLNHGISNWGFLFVRDGIHTKVTSPVLPSLNDVLFKTNSSLNKGKLIDSTDLRETHDVINVRRQDDLQISWKLDSKEENNAIVSININGVSGENNLSCKFKANEKIAYIENRYFNNFESGLYSLSVTLDETNFIAKYGWIIKTSDWKIGRMKIL